MRSALHSNFLLPRRSPTVTRISPHLEAFSRRSFDFLKNFGNARNSPDAEVINQWGAKKFGSARNSPVLASSRDVNNQWDSFGKSELFKTPKC